MYHKYLELTVNFYDKKKTVDKVYNFLESARQNNITQVHFSYTIFPYSSRFIKKILINFFNT